MARIRSARWCFTWNNPPTTDEIGYEELLREINGHDSVRYLCAQLEAGESGTRHLQGYLQLYAATGLNRVRDLFGVGYPHLEPQRGSNTQARDYCKKPETRLEGPWEFGEFCVGRGARTDIAAAAAMVQDRGVKRAAQEHPEVYVKYSMGLHRLEALMAEPRHSKPLVTVIWGSTGAGKTKAVFEDSPDVFNGAYVQGRNVWFDGWSGKTPLLLDEFDSANWPIQFLLRLLDRYPMSVPVKGSTVVVQDGCTHIYLVSNVRPNNWWPDCAVDVRAAFARRVAIWLEFGPTGAITSHTPETAWW